MADFGVARSRDARRPTVGISGTIPFMSPEQTRGEPIDLRSDVFSAGVRAVHAARGRVPVRRGGRRAETLGEIQLCRYPPPAGRGTARAASSRCCAARWPRAPSDRFPSAGAFADAMDELMFAQGWRGGAGALRDRLRAAFPHERDAAERAVRARASAARASRSHPPPAPARERAVARRGRRPPSAAPTRPDGVAAQTPRASSRAPRARSRQSASPPPWPPAP